MQKIQICISYNRGIKRKTLTPLFFFFFFFFPPLPYSLLTPSQISPIHHLLSRFEKHRKETSKSMFNPQTSSFVGGLALLTDPSQITTSHSSDSPLMADGGLEHLRQFGDSPVFRMLAPVSFHSPSDGYDFSSYGTPAIFYDPAMAMNLNLESGFVYPGMEDAAYVGQIDQISQIERRRRQGMAISGFEEYGTQKNEKQRRERLGKKFELLKSLIPNPTKPDRATIVSDTIDYIKELLRTVDDLKLLVGKKRSKSARSIKLEMSDEGHGEMESSSIKSIVDESEQGMNGSMRSSWIQRRSKSTFVDVRIIEDEVYIKLEQRKRVGCSLIVSRVLDELQLDLLHLSGGNVGDSHIFMISTKTNYEGSPVYASSVAKRFIEVMDIN